MLVQALLVLLFLGTAAAVTIRPLGWSEGRIAIAAALLALALGWIGPSLLWRSLSSSANVLFFFSGLLLLAAASSRCGLIDSLFGTVLRRVGQSPARLLLAVALVTSLVTATLSNDAAALLFAPIALRAVRQRRLPLMPFLLAMAFMANSASLLLPTGNPVNLVILDQSGLRLTTYLTRVTPAALAGVVLLLALTWLVGRLWPWPGSPAAAPEASRSWSPEDRVTIRFIGAELGVLGLVDVVAVLLGIPLGLPTAGAGLVAVASLWLRGQGTPRATCRRVGWSLLPLVLGLSVLAGGLSESGPMAQAAAHLLHGPVAPALALGSITAGLSGLLNNLPAALLVTTLVQGTGHLRALALPIIVGADLGPNLAPMGSLSTLLLFGAARRQSLQPSWGWFWGSCWAVGPLSLAPVLLLVGVGH